MGKFKSYDFGHHGAEGLSHGGEIWGDKKQTQKSSEDLLLEYDRNLGAITSKMVVIAREFYINKDGMSVDEIANRIVRFQQSMLEFEDCKKEFYKEYINLEYSINADKDYKVLFNVLNDMKETVRQKNESNGIRR